MILLQYGADASQLTKDRLVSSAHKSDSTLAQMRCVGLLAVTLLTRVTGQFQPPPQADPWSIRNAAWAALNETMAATSTWETDGLLHYGPASVPFCRIMQMPFCAGAHYMVTEAFTHQRALIAGMDPNNKDRLYWEELDKGLAYWIDLTIQGITSSVRLSMTGSKPWWVCPFCRVTGGDNRICHHCTGKAWWNGTELRRGLNATEQIAHAAREMVDQVGRAGSSGYLRPDRPFTPFCMFTHCKSIHEPFQDVLPRFVVSANETLRQHETVFPAPLTKLIYTRAAVAALRRLEAFPQTERAYPPRIAESNSRGVYNTVQQLVDSAKSSGAGDLVWPSSMPYRKFMPCETPEDRIDRVLYAARFATTESLKWPTEYKRALLDEIERYQHRSRGSSSLSLVVTSVATVVGVYFVLMTIVCCTA